MCKKLQTVICCCSVNVGRCTEVMKQRPAHIKSLGCCAKGHSSSFIGGSGKFEAENNTSRFHFC